MATILALLTSAKAVLSTVWAFLKTKAGKIILVITGAVLALWLVYHRGYSAGQGACVAAHKAAAAQTVQRQTQAASGAVTRANGRVAQNTKSDDYNKGVIRDVTRNAATLPDGSDTCIPAALADQLRSLE